ncbi:hypothetical protein FRC00_004765 [Tulasnella sp. 408]|nr:hypothetical protein FRC00_004765 [Tulasnella sp. 408]
MATPRVTLSTPPPSGPVEPSPAASAESLDENLPTAARAVFKSLAHLIIVPERLTFVDYPVSLGGLCDVRFAKLDEISHTPKDVAVERLTIGPIKDHRRRTAIRLARQLKVWEGLRHPNVLELLGYYLSPNYDTAQLISPYMINESTGGKGTCRYMSPELTVGEERPKSTPASDVWAWGCTAFEILTGDRVFKEKKTDGLILLALFRREQLASPARILGLLPEAPKPEYASTLRLLHSYIPICWEYEPRKRPSISLVRRQAFVFSFENDMGDSVATLEELADLLIPTERLRLVERSLGSGNYGEVVLGTLDETSPTPRDVAVKRLKAVGTRGERIRLAKRLARELNIWAKINHPNIVELIGWYLDEKYESPLLISALMPNGDVLKYIETFKPDIQQRISFANVLIDLHMNAVLCDFGLASFVGDSPTAPGLVTTTAIKGGTPRYMSPELHLDEDCTHNLEGDVWAWACTVFHILTGTIPYAKYLGERQLCMAIVLKQPPGDIALLLPNSFERVDSESRLALQFLHSVIPSCWDFESQHRPKMCNLLSQMSNLSHETVNAAHQDEDVPSGGSGDGASLPEASQNASRGLADSGESAGQGVGSVDVLDDPAPENLLTREHAGPYSSEDAHDDGDDQQLLARPEGSSGLDGRMRDKEDDDQDQRNTLKAQLLALVAALDEDAQMRGSQVPHENPIGVQGIRQALGSNWESQLAAVLQGIDLHKKKGDTTATPKESRGETS